MSKAYSQIPVVVASEVTPVLGGQQTDVAPTGRWKDGLCSCCSLGCFHASLWCACCFPQILMGQLLTRMKMSWLGGGPNPESGDWRKTFRRVVTVVILYALLTAYLSPPPAKIVETDDDILGFEEVPPTETEYPHWKQQWYDVLNFCFCLYSLVVMMKLRYAVREMYRIPGSRCEDCCCVFWCGCCTVAQLARQTADYEDQRAECCSSTGLPASSEPILTPAVVV